MFFRRMQFVDNMYILRKPEFLIYSYPIAKEL